MKMLIAILIASNFVLHSELAYSYPSLGDQVSLEGRHSNGVFQTRQIFTDEIDSWGRHFVTDEMVRHSSCTSCADNWSERRPITVSDHWDGWPRPYTPDAIEEVFKNCSSEYGGVLELIYVPMGSFLKTCKIRKESKEELGYFSAETYWVADVPFGFAKYAFEVWNETYYTISYLELSRSIDGGSK